MIGIIIFCIFSTTNVISGEVFTSIAEMEEILQVEAIYIDCLESVVKQDGKVAASIQL